MRAEKRRDAVRAESKATAKAGFQLALEWRAKSKTLDSGFRRNDKPKQERDDQPSAVENPAYAGMTSRNQGVGGRNFAKERAPTRTCE